MNLWKFAALITGMAVVMLAIKKTVEKVPVIARDQDKRYTTDDFLDDLDK